MSAGVVHLWERPHGFWQYACGARRGTRGQQRALKGTTDPVCVTCARCLAIMRRREVATSLAPAR